MYYGSQIINEYYDDTNNGRMADWWTVKLNWLEQYCHISNNRYIMQVADHDDDKNYVKG